MRLARWVLTWELATFRGVSGHPTEHAYVDGSSAPICMPHVAGAPPIGLAGAVGVHCRVCYGLIVQAYGSWVPCGVRVGGLAWSVRADHRLPVRMRGTATDEVDALRQCMATLDLLLPGDIPVEWQRGYDADAREYARELRADARASKRSDATVAQLTEYVFRHVRHFPSWFSSDFEWRTEKARVVKKTAKRIFVEASIRTTEKGNTVLRTYSLDRAELEAGKKSRYGWTLDPTPPFDPATGKPGRPGWAVTLDVELPTTLVVVKRAFRAKAKAAHPDHGGTPEDFACLKSAYDAACTYLGGAA